MFPVSEPRSGAGPIAVLSCLLAGLACSSGNSPPANGQDAGSTGDAGTGSDAGTPTQDTSDGGSTFPPAVGQIHCDDPLFVDSPALSWVEVSATPSGGMAGIAAAIAASDRTRPTRIRVGPGTYTGHCLSIEDHQRSASAPLWLKGEGEVQISCDNGNGQAIGFVHSSYVAIEGFTIGPASGYYGDSGIHISGATVHPEDPAYYGLWNPSHHFILRGNVLRNLNRGPDGDANPDHYESACCDGAKSNQTEWVWYVGNTVSRTARHGIDNVGVHHAAVCNNTMIDLVGEGQGVEAKAGSSDILIEGNLFQRVFHRAIFLGGEGSNNNFMWPTGFPTEAYGVVARNNVIVDAADGGITFYGCWSCTAINNSVWFRPGYSVVASHDWMRMYPSILEPGTFTEWGVAKRAGEVLTNKDNRVVNNFFGAAAGDLTCPLDAAGDGTGTIGLTLGHNAFWNGGQPLPECGTASTTLAYFPGAGTPLATDPRVTAAGAFPGTPANLRPLAGSPLLGAGQTDPLVPAKDQTGRARPSPPTIGALEP